jgi:hypothetical protein
MAQSRFAHVDSIPQQDSAERAVNKLACTFAVQVAALKRYRTGGEPTVRVERVTVNEGGQAIVGNASQWGVGLKDGDVLMNAVYPFQKSPLCSPTSKRTRRRTRLPVLGTSAGAIAIRAVLESPLRRLAPARS